MRLPSPFEYSGVIHVHTDRSDGTAGYEYVAAAARAAGADFLIVTDHDTLGGGPSVEGWYDGLLLLVGAEVSPDRNHYLCLGIGEVPSRELAPAEVVESVARQGGLGFLGHPNDVGSPFLRLPSYRWDAWPLTGFTGLEVWNFFSQLVARSQNLPAALLTALFPVWRVNGPPRENLALWDSLAARGRTVGIAGVDAHGGGRWDRLPLIVASYRRQLRTLRTNVLLEEPLRGELDADRRAVLGALARGRCYMQNLGVGAERGFALYYDDALMGDEVSFRRGMALRVEVPREARCVLVRDGAVVEERRGRRVLFPVARPGAYRVEVYRGRFPWIFSNHIYVR